MKQQLINLFKEYFEPYATIPVLGLAKSFIKKEGYSENDIQDLIDRNCIEKSDTGYRMTSEYIKQWAGNSYKYIPEFERW